MDNKEWKRLVKRLRQRFPIDAKVSVRRVKLKKDAGFTWFDGERYHIRIDKSLGPDAQTDTLLHEWAHALTMEEAYRHKASWGINYAKVYDSWENNFPLS